MSTTRLIAALVICAAGLLAGPPTALAQSADLALRMQLVPDEPLDAGDQADIVFTVENRGPDGSGRVRVLGAPIIVVSGFNGAVLFHIERATIDSCPLFFSAVGDPAPGGAQSSRPFFDFPDIAAGESVSCRLHIMVADPLRRATVMTFEAIRVSGSTPDPNQANNLVSFAVGSDAPRVIPAGGPAALTLLAVLLGALGARGVRRRGRAGAQ